MQPLEKELAQARKDMDDLLAGRTVNLIPHDQQAEYFRLAQVEYALKWRIRTGDYWGWVQPVSWWFCDNCSTFVGESRKPMVCPDCNTPCNGTPPHEDGCDCFYCSP